MPFSLIPDRLFDAYDQITPELLYRCYHTFYNLNNMVLLSLIHI